MQLRIHLAVTIFLLSSFLFHVSLHGDIKSNSASPVNKNCGKTLILKEALRIRDIGEKYYFKYPFNVRMAKDSYIYALDDKEFLKFTPDGKFVKNFFKYGAGPFEVMYISNYSIKGNNLIFHDSAQNKVLILDHNSDKNIKEFRILSGERYEYLTEDENTLYFLRQEPYETKGKLEVTNIDMSLLTISMDGKNITKVFGFPLEHLVIKQGDRIMRGGRAAFLRCFPQNGMAFFSHTPDYSIKLFDLKKHAVLKEIKRKYYRVKVTKKNKKYAPGGGIGKLTVDGKNFFKIPLPDYLPDIQQIFINKDKLWVFTSTVKGENKVLVDVYDLNGTYLDNFFIECPSPVSPYRITAWIQDISNDKFITVEEDEDGQYYIKVSVIVGYK